MASLVTSFLMTACLALTQAACPHQNPLLQPWSLAASWPNHAKPQKGSRVVISTPTLLDEAVPELYSITISPGGSLVFSPALDHQLRLRFLEVHGEMHVGSESCRFNAKVNITLLVDEIKAKLANFRTCHLLKVLASKKSGAVTGDVYQPTYKYFKQLDFLQKVTNKRSSQTNLDSQLGNFQELETVELEDSQKQQQEEEGTSS